MKLVKAILIIVLVLAVLGAAVWQFWLKGQVSFAVNATAYGAKQVCSCLYVAERAFESCQGDFTADTSLVSFEIIETVETTPDQATLRSQSVKASVLGGLVSNTARFEPGLGCALVE